MKSWHNCIFVTGYAWAEDKEHCEEYGRMLQADPAKVSARAKKRGLPQVILTAAVSFSNSQQSSRELNLGQVVRQKVDNTIHWITLCPVVNNTISFPITYPAG